MILKEKKISLESSGVEESYLNKFFLKLIEQICNTKIIKKKRNIKKFIEKYSNFADNNSLKNEKNEIEYYSLSKFFKINNDKLVNCWSILFIDN